MREVLCAGGYLIVTTPANGVPLHAYPKDYWRILPDAYRELIFEGMVIVEEQFADNGGAWWCLGKKPQ